MLSKRGGHFFLHKSENNYKKIFLFRIKLYLYIIKQTNTYTMTIEFKGQEITIDQLVTIIRELADMSANGYGSLYRNLTVINDDLSVDVKLRVSDHFPNPTRCYDNNTLSFALPGAEVHVGVYRHGFMFLDNDYNYIDTYESLENVVEEYLNECLQYAY